MNFFRFGSKGQQEELSIEKFQLSEKDKIWHKCSEHKHYFGLPMEPPLAEGEVYKKGEYELFKKHLSLRLYSDKLIFFKVFFFLKTFKFEFFYKIHNGQVKSHPHAIVFCEVPLKVHWNFSKEKKGNEENLSQKNKLIGFTLTKNHCSIEFSSESPDFLEILKRKSCVTLFSRNFYDDFVVLKPIGKGTSATVRLFKKKL